MTGNNDDILTMTADEIRESLVQLRAAVRDHRDQRSDNRCWFDDEKLYLMLPEKYRGKTELNDKELMYGNCRRFINTRVHPDDRFAWGDVPGGSMMEILEQVEKELPSFLLRASDWNSLLIDDELPNVEHVWMRYGQGRLCLHVIHPCASGGALFHPHPWPSIVRVVSGSYETAYGHGSPDGPHPPMGATKTIAAGKWFEMVNPEAWHTVSPIGGPVMTLMIAGLPWNQGKHGKKSDGHRKGRSLSPLSETRKAEIIEAFRGFYPLKPF